MEVEQSKFYLPVAISLRDVYDYLETLLYNLQVIEGIDLTIIIDAMLQDIFFSKKVSFGKYSGAMGAYQIQLPEFVTIDLDKTEQVIEEVQQHLRDTIGMLFPTMKAENSGYLFKYLKGEEQTDLKIYVPTDPTTCSDDYRSKLMLAEAVRLCIGVQ